MHQGAASNDRLVLLDHPNGPKITIFLEEAGVAYKIVPVNISQDGQFKPEFLAISPNNRIPAIVDHEPKDGGKPIPVFELGAILLYLAEKTGEFMHSDLRRKVEVTQWLFWQMGGRGPMAGQNHHFSQYAPEKIPYAIDRYVTDPPCGPHRRRTPSRHRRRSRRSPELHRRPRTRIGQQQFR